MIVPIVRGLQGLMGRIKLLIPRVEDTTYATLRVVSKDSVVLRDLVLDHGCKNTVNFFLAMHP